MYANLFSEIKLGGVTLKNRLIMAPTYLGYAGDGGTITPMLLDHYRLMAQSGVAMVVVENCTVDNEHGSGSKRTIRADTDANLEGLTQLAAAIKDQGTLACLQINHAGRFAMAARQPLAPSAVETFGRTPRALKAAEIPMIVTHYARAARRARDAGFDMVELHGGTGYLLAQFFVPPNQQAHG